MKGRIKGSDLYSVEISEEGNLVVERHAGSSPHKMFFSPEQASALAEFIRQSGEEMSKKYKTAFWSK